MKYRYKDMRTATDRTPDRPPSHPIGGFHDQGKREIVCRECGAIEETRSRVARVCGDCRRMSRWWRGN